MKLTDITPDEAREVLRASAASEFFHPDLIQAADVVVGKLGYSTLAEVYNAGAPIAYLPRPRFAESPKLEAWVRERLSCRRLAPADLETPAWLEKARELFDAPRRAPGRADGADEVASLVLEIVSGP